MVCTYFIGIIYIYIYIYMCVCVCVCVCVSKHHTLCVCVILYFYISILINEYFICPYHFHAKMICYTDEIFELNAHKTSTCVIGFVKMISEVIRTH